MPRHGIRCGENGQDPPNQETQVKNMPTLKKSIVAASVVAGVAGGLVAGLALGVPGFAGASSNGIQGTAASFAKNAVVRVADANTDTNTATELPGTITVQGSTGADHAPRGPRAAVESDAVAKVLGLTAAELRTELQSGKSLADVAKAKGVDTEKVKAAILEDFTAREQAEVASGEHTQAEVDQKIADFKTRLDDIVNGVRPAGMPGDDGHDDDHGPRGEHGRGHGPRGGHGPCHEGDMGGAAGAQGGSAPTLQGDVQVQPSSTNA
jgi:hypothetical protein